MDKAKPIRNKDANQLKAIGTSNQPIFAPLFMIHPHTYIHPNARLATNVKVDILIIFIVSLF